ncbi:MAG TPA: hypothetical protein VKZ53_22985 [Candidatus Angelobacter sp.]|nr:hypothetical protein [Candidatus Angelobacter sp.]
MTPQELAEKIAALSTEQQEAVQKFIAYLQRKNPSSISFRDAVDEFMNEHSELMRLLAQ